MNFFVAFDERKTEKKLKNIKKLVEKLYVRYLITKADHVSATDERLPNGWRLNA